jgi:hypothetical protein
MSLPQKQKNTIREEFTNLTNGSQQIKLFPFEHGIIESFMLNKLDQAYQQGAKDKVEEVLKLKGNFWEDEDHAVGGYISKKELKTLLLKDNT